MKYGFIFHVQNFVNDFYPIYWGFGGKSHDDNGEMIFLQAEMLARAQEALGEIVGMQGALAPSPGAIKISKGQPLCVRPFCGGRLYS